jgi:hypothetical protein
MWPSAIVSWPRIGRIMLRILPLAAAILVAASLATSSAHAIDWLTAPSYYTHDRVTGDRVAQYSPIGPFYYYARPDFIRSGYRHLRSSIQVAGSADNLHIVEEWGNPVRPYGEWRFPYRPYSVPYDQWGPSFNGLGPGGVFAPGGWGGGGWGGGFPSGGFPGGGFPGGGFPGGGGKGNPAVNFAQPWMDGYYPSYDLNDRSQYYKPYVAPKH